MNRIPVRVRVLPKQGAPFVMTICDFHNSRSAAWQAQKEMTEQSQLAG